MFFNKFDDFIGATAYSSETVKQNSCLLQVKVKPQPLINKFVLNQLPKLIVLQIHTRARLNRSKQRGHSFAIQSLNLLLHCGDDHVPEVGCAFESVHRDLVEPVHYLLVSHVLAVLLVDKDEVVCVFGALECEVYFVVPEGVVVVEVDVAAGVHRVYESLCCRYKQSNLWLYLHFCELLGDSSQHFTNYL